MTSAKFKVGHILSRISQMKLRKVNKIYYNTERDRLRFPFYTDCIIIVT